jgi:lipoate-protein ligase A
MNRGYSTLAKAAAPLRIIVSSSNNPFYNLSFESFLLQNLERETGNKQRTLFLWRNEPTVVIGRHQNPYSECDIKYMNDNGVHLTRRASGGGAVYQDLGNSIFTFLSNRSLFAKENNFSIIKNAMGALGFAVDVSGRNDMTILVPDLESNDTGITHGSGFIPGCDLKISGSAFKALQNAELHHGTILVDVNMEQMAKILTPSQLKLQSKGIKSVRSRVINLKKVPSLFNEAISKYGEGVIVKKDPQTGKYKETGIHLTKSNFVREINHDVICNSLQTSFMQFYNHDPRQAEILQSKDITDEKLEQMIEQMKNPEWRYGASPKFTIQFSHKFPFALVDVHINKISQSIIDNTSIYTDSLLTEWVPLLEQNLKGVNFSRKDVMNAGKTTAEKLSPEEASICMQVTEWICDELHL